ncbi:hypothetical protein [Nocardiopsis sp. NRRL B-16309]|uniref:hypothetical protein n=1 Tax=Nocardiopsis sp. NRRL B-16309 TaxID=1519494 RepID=UPI0006AEE8FC|nr:hypothetical protein [Nocardiopsis sp. NRRL B-16309]
MTAVCDLHELATLAELRAWARAHGTRVRYLGPTLEGRPLYAATRGPSSRVVVDPRPDPHPRPLVWHSPLERLTPAMTP